jgi:serine-type D-Ala-D-Ala carboxypeptidase (penicillin-binding protein 5/6)
MMRFVVALVFFLSFFGVALAETAPLPDIAAKQAFLVDSATNAVLFAKNADEQMAPSSMSKMMTLYMVFDALKAGKLKMDDMLSVSERAWRQEGSRMFLNVGEKAKVEDLIRGVVVQSGNDASVVFAESLGSGSESGFADLMNEKAKEIGLTGSHFANATGLPDPAHYMTAHDLATLAVALQRDFPEFYHYFSEISFRYNNIEQGNRNPLLYRNMNVDGLKTGHTEAGGFGLTASCVRDGRRMVLVLNGMKNMQARADESAKAFDYGYREFGLYPIAKTGDVMANPSVWLGKSKNVQIVAGKEAVITLPRAARKGLKVVVSFMQPIAAPIMKGEELGQMTLTAPGMETKTVPLVAAVNVERIGFFPRIIEKLGVIFKKG